jgi:glycosyltransferase involved in cell wall biosynthesis
VSDKRERIGSETRPRVTVGLPVYNGEVFLAEAIQSILDQTFTDFEIIISDNASADGTEGICRSFVERDPRVRYIRQPKNLGAAPNFNLLVPLARGEYFKWAACDDLLAPRFLEKCVEALDHAPEASLCCTHTMEIAADGSPLKEVRPLPGLVAPSVSRRFGALLMNNCYEVFGLIRIEMLRRTRPIVSSFYGDGILLCALSTLGPYAIVPEPLFISRKHEAQSINLIDDRVSYAEWFDAKNKGKLLLPHWRMFGELTRTALVSPMPVMERVKCLRRVALRAWNKRDRLYADLERGVRQIGRHSGPELRSRPSSSNPP